MKRRLMTKIYEVTCNKEKFKFYITTFTGNTVHGEIWLGFSAKIEYKKVNTASTEIKNIEFDGTSEESVYAQIIEWIDEILGKNCIIELVETR